MLVIEIIIFVFAFTATTILINRWRNNKRSFWAKKKLQAEAVRIYEKASKLLMKALRDPRTNESGKTKLAEAKFERFANDSKYNMYYDLSESDYRFLIREYGEVIRVLSEQEASLTPEVVTQLDRTPRPRQRPQRIEPSNTVTTTTTTVVEEDVYVAESGIVFDDIVDAVVNAVILEEIFDDY